MRVVVKSWCQVSGSSQVGRSNWLQFPVEESSRALCQMDGGIHTSASPCQFVAHYIETSHGEVIGFGTAQCISCPLACSSPSPPPMP